MPTEWVYKLIGSLQPQLLFFRLLYFTLSYDACKYVTKQNKTNLIQSLVPSQILCLGQGGI